MTDRIPLDNLTSDQLDQLYDDLDQACTLAGPELHDRLTAAINALGKSETELAGHRATLDRVRDLADRWVKAGPPPLGVSITRWWDARLVELRAAIRPAAEQPARTTVDNSATSSDLGTPASAVPECGPACDEQHAYDWTCALFAGVDDSDPSDLTGYLAPEPGIGCLTVTADPDPFGYEERERTGRNAGLTVEAEDAAPPPAT